MFCLCAGRAAANSHACCFLEHTLTFRVALWEAKSCSALRSPSSRLHCALYLINAVKSTFKASGNREKTLHHSGVHLRFSCPSLMLLAQHLQNTSRAIFLSFPLHPPLASSVPQPRAWTS